MQKKILACTADTDDKPIIQLPKKCCDFVNYKSNFKKPIIISDPTKVNKYRRPQSEYLASKLYNNCQAFNPSPRLNKNAAVPFGCKTFTPLKPNV